MQAHHRLYAGFFLFAFTLGSTFSRLPDIQLAFGARESELGLTLIGLSVGSILGLTFAAPIIARLGVKASIGIPLVGIALFCALIPHMPRLEAVFGLLVCAGLLVGALEVCLNVETDRQEAQLGFGIMSRAHSLWSFGFFAAALVGSFMRQADVSTGAHLALLVPTAAIGIAIIARGLVPAPIRANGAGEKAPLLAFPTLSLLGICAIAFSPMMVEGAGVDWSLIYMRDIFATEPLVSGLALTSFTLLMAITRWHADPVVARFGARRVAAGLLALSGLGVFLVGVAPHPALAILGFTLMGIGCSAVYPITISAAAQRTDRPAAVNVAALGQSAFVIFFLAPPLLGFVAEHFGIRNSYLICLPMILVSIACLRALAPRQAPAY